MWTAIICTVIGIGLAIWIEYSFGSMQDFFSYIMASLLGMLVGFFFGVTIAFALPMQTEYVVETYSVETLQDNSSVSGSFFLGCGQIEGKMKYVFYYETNGMHRMKQLDYDEVSIKYSDKDPKVEEHREVPTDAFINNFAEDCLNRHYIIYVPKGTIQNSYNLDAK